MKYIPHLFSLSLACCAGASLTPVLAQPAAPKPIIAGPVLSVQRNADGLTLKQQQGTLQLQVFTPRIVRVLYRPNGAPPPAASLTVTATPAATAKNWKFVQNANEVILSTPALQVKVNLATGNVTFSDARGATILAESPEGRKMESNTIGELKTLKSQQNFVLAPDEAIFGLGQHQDGAMNYRGQTVHLQQKNTDIGIPILVSSRGYGVLWDNPAVTDVNVGQSEAKTLRWSSEAARSIDYYFIYGPQIDDVIRGVRELSGPAPMFPRWVWGMWQSKERYQSQQELLNVAKRYRDENIPLDGIVQDWRYWDPSDWGSHDFDPARYPDPKAAVEQLHAMNVHTLISVWAKFEGTSTAKTELQQAGALYPQAGAKQAQYYDPFNADARALYWKQLNQKIFAKGFDSWWLDASEPELSIKWGEFRNFKTALGWGSEVFNAYPLLHTQGVYQGQRAVTDEKRVFTMTRSAYAGQQRNAAMVWSGDINGDWAALAAQVPAGINFTLSGIPYWNSDTGGFHSGSPANPDYRELFTRWFQFSTFTPMLRIHGTGSAKEFWRFDGDTQKILLNYDKLRYHLLPYIYSTSWQVTSNGASMMRPLLNDFRTDAKVYNIPDQYLFGPSIMACPVTRPMAASNSAIPAARLFDANGVAGGLSGAYFTGKNFENKIAERKDADLDFDLNGKGPIAGVDATNWSARWEGSVQTDKAGTYHFALGADDGMRLWVNGKILVEDWNAREYVEKTASIDLPANTRVPIKIEFFQNTNGAKLKLGWSQGPSIPPARAVYLPAGTQWFDFWTGQTLAGGQTVQAAAPIEKMPLYVRAGAILPYGPEVQYTAQKSDPTEVRIYRGANGAFTLYEDEGDNYNYEKGVYATIPLTWNDRAQTLTIGKRAGQFPGMLKERTFRIVVVGLNKGVGVANSPMADKTVQYRGDTVEVHLP